MRGEWLCRISQWLPQSLLSLVVLLPVALGTRRPQGHPLQHFATHGLTLTARLQTQYYIPRTVKSSETMPMLSEHETTAGEVQNESTLSIRQFQVQQRLS